MHSLNAHLRDVDAHDRLTFHPACPICRQTRLSGELAALELISPRARALMAAGVLAIATTGPVPAVLAAETDQEHEGAAPAGQTAPAGSALDATVELGGDATALPELPPAAAGDDPQAAAADAPTSADIADPVVDAGDGSQTALNGSPAGEVAASQPVASGTGPAPSTAPAAVTTPDTVADSAPAPPVSPLAGAGAHVDAARDGTEPASRRPSSTPDGKRVAQHRTRAVAPVTVAASETVNALRPAQASAESSTRGRHARPGERTHVVLAGESLWSISSDLLGDRATPAQIAREVHRLWKLNRERIGTGDPDLILIDTTLRLQ